jgi:GH35 family endo-1,4-beta-xylanase
LELIEVGWGLLLGQQNKLFGNLLVRNNEGSADGRKRQKSGCQLHVDELDMDKGEREGEAIERDVVCKEWTKSRQSWMTLFDQLDCASSWDDTDSQTWS